MVKPLENLVTAITAKPANVDFLLLLIAVFDPVNEIFKKSYVWKKPDMMSVQPKYDNADGLFSGLPQLSAGIIKKTNRLRVPKEKSLALKLLRV